MLIALDLSPNFAIIASNKEYLSETTLYWAKKYIFRAIYS